MLRPQRGFTLLELAVVIIILGLVAVAAVPSFSSADDRKLELAATEVADAVRYARSEALRTGKLYGFRVQTGANRIQVFRADTGTTPPTPVYDVYHPVSKRLYDLDLGERPMLSGVTISSSAPVWRGTCNAPTFVLFAATGTAQCSDPTTVLLEQGTISLTLQGTLRDVVVDGVSGRVTTP